MDKKAEFIPTSELFQMIENMGDLSAEMDKFFSGGKAPSFHKYLKELMEEHGIGTAELGAKTLLSRSYSYQMCAGDRLPNRDIILRIALVMELSVDVTQRLLKLANRGALYPKIKRDAVLIFAVMNKLSLYDTDELLINSGLDPLL